MASPGQSPGGAGDNKQVEQGVKDVSSNLATLLKDLGAKDTQLISALGTLAASIIAGAATLGVVGAAVGAVAAIVSIFASSSPDPVASALKSLLTQLQKLAQADAAATFDAWLRDIQAQTGAAQTIMTALPSLAARLPLDASEVTNQLEQLVKVLTTLAPPDVSNRGCNFAGLASLGSFWLQPVNFEVYWNVADSADAQLDFAVPFGYGEQTPTPEVGGSVFYYTYILPAFLYAVNAFLAVGAVIDPNFKQNWGTTVIRPTACFLQSVHDYILGKGITPLAAPPVPLGEAPVSNWTVSNLNDSWSQAVRGELFGSDFSVRPGIKSTVAGQTQPNISIEYGAVEKFSGYSSMGIYTIVGPVPSQPIFPASFTFEAGPNYFGKFQIRLLRRKKDVYAGSGLPAVWAMINQLKSLVGDAPLPGPRFHDWSIRRDIVPLAGVTDSKGNISLKAIQKFLLNTPPVDVPSPGPFVVSFRSLISV